MEGYRLVLRVGDGRRGALGDDSKATSTFSFHHVYNIYFYRNPI